MKSSHSEQERKHRKKVVVDTSVLISATIVDGAYRKLIRRLLEMDFELCIPQAVIDEYHDITSQSKFDKYQPLFTEIFSEFSKSSIILPAPSIIKYTFENSPEDEVIINCCVENSINYLITADKKTVGTFNGLEVIYVTDFYSHFLIN